MDFQVAQNWTLWTLTALAASWLLFGLFGTLLVMHYLTQRKKPGHLIQRTGSFVIALHFFSFWAFNAIARTFFGYSYPTVGLSAWGIIKDLHVGISLFLMTYVIYKYE